jgi:hypothetical protein
MAATGATWQEIADQLGYRSRQAASQAVKRLGNRTRRVRVVRRATTTRLRSPAKYSKLGLQP